MYKSQSIINKIDAPISIGIAGTYKVMAYNRLVLLTWDQGQSEDD